jgi:hypothetical protein
MIHPAPYQLRNVIGAPEEYFIHPGYTIRKDNEEFDDTPFRDEFQREVYEYARQVLDAEKFKSVCDIGCGSGFKLITNFFDVETLGIELPQTAEFLCKKWPGRNWADHNDPIDAPYDLIISSDVIEHVADPNELLTKIKEMQPKRIILSTPERDQLCLGTHNGPPKNIHHVREWNYSEFGAYIGSWFHIREHFVVNGTQVVECFPSA